ncbi:type II secretion system GspH family protein [Myxococcota bacterium]|nr:type II secretion system GspH family protein [Myxococcota bacterium]MCZ7618736.1 type II secretion system GspH family protein [Myxococcota bacterium]
MTTGRARARSGRSGFTLIELLAVLAIFALIAGFALPRFQVGGGRAVRNEAETLGESFEFARQRAIMTARPHHVVLDLEAGRHWVEWAPPPPTVSEATAAAHDERAPGSRQVDMTPPSALDTGPSFEPVPGALGRPRGLGDDVVFGAVRFPDGTLDRGVVTLTLGADGVADPAVVSLVAAEGGTLYEIEVQALADAVLVVDASR